MTSAIALPDACANSQLSISQNLPCSCAHTAARTGQRITGGIVVYCAGCMLAVQARLEEAQASLQAELDAPFLTLFTFGEQGPTATAGNLHSNLMISVVLFHE